MHVNLAKALVSLGQLDQAAAHYERAVALKPELAEPYHYLGNIDWTRGKLDQAVARYRASARAQARPGRYAQQPGERAHGAGQAGAGPGML